MTASQANHRMISTVTAESALHEAETVECYSNTPPSSHHHPLPRTASSRLHLSTTTLTTPIPAPPLAPLSEKVSEKEKTVLYLGYGSNLSSHTFRAPRDVHPLSSTCVHVPSLTLTFDLLGVPYREPCFANAQVRKITPPAPPTVPLVPIPPEPSDPSKELKWDKGLIGIVYELTQEDYQKIIVTEGGGLSYVDVLVPCFVIQPGSKTVDPIPRTTPFLAHTLSVPSKPLSYPVGEASKEACMTATPSTTHPRLSSYAQPSLRYLNILIAGAAEHALPLDYQAYLQSLHTYHITTRRQLVGKWIAINIWWRIEHWAFALGRILADEHGRYPKWYALLLTWLFATLRAWYNGPLGKKMWGDGERTEGDKPDSLGLGRWKDVEQGIGG